MNSKAKIKENLEAVRIFGEKACRLYAIYIARLKDSVMIEKIQKIHDEEARHVYLADEALAIFRKYENDKAISKVARWQVPQVMIYLAIGVLLGLGAPLGALLLRIYVSHATEIINWVRQEVASQTWFYLYMALGSIAAFVSFALTMAGIHKRLKQRARLLGTKTKILERKSAKDPLTGLYNFGYVRERLNIEIERAKRFQTPLSCLMIDIDKLKESNDRYGHLAGDELLRRVAELIKEEVRMIDTAIRYGGDEFFVILPVTPIHGAQVVAERIREKSKQEVVRYNEVNLHRTVSVGIASFPSPGIHDTESLMEAADKALYEAKRRGRDKSLLPSMEFFLS